MVLPPTTASGVLVYKTRLFGIVIGRTWSLIATWVVLLDASLASLDTAVAAVEEDAGMGSFDGVLLAGEQLSGAVHAARQNLAGGD